MRKRRKGKRKRRSTRVVEEVDAICVHVGGEEVEKQGEETEGVARGKHAFNCEWKFARREPFICSRKRFRAMAPRPSFFEGNHCGTSPSFFERNSGSACRRALHLLMESVVVALVFEWKSLF